MNTLHSQKDSARPARSRKRVGRGPGSGMGKTCCRGQKGEGARSGYKRRYGKEGGQFPLYMKLPTRGFSNARFKKVFHTINVGQLEKLLEAGTLKADQTINAETLAEVGLFHGASAGLKILGEGEISKPVVIEAQAFSSGAREKLQKAGATCTVVDLKKARVAK